jgi:hypothetical protein
MSWRLCRIPGELKTTLSNNYNIKLELYEFSIYISFDNGRTIII